MEQQSPTFETFETGLIIFLITNNFATTECDIFGVELWQILRRQSQVSVGEGERKRESERRRRSSQSQSQRTREGGGGTRKDLLSSSPPPPPPPRRHFPSSLPLSNPLVSSSFLIPYQPTNEPTTEEKERKRKIYIGEDTHATTTSYIFAADLGSAVT